MNRIHQFERGWQKHNVKDYSCGKSKETYQILLVPCLIPCEYPCNWCIKIPSKKSLRAVYWDIYMNWCYATISFDICLIRNLQWNIADVVWVFVFRCYFFHGVYLLICAGILLKGTCYHVIEGRYWNCGSMCVWDISYLLYVRWYNCIGLPNGDGNAKETITNFGIWWLENAFLMHLFRWIIPCV